MQYVDHQFINNVIVNHDAHIINNNKKVQFTPISQTNSADSSTSDKFLPNMENNTKSNESQSIPYYQLGNSNPISSKDKSAPSIDRKSGKNVMKFDELMVQNALVDNTSHLIDYHSDTVQNEKENENNLLPISNPTNRHLLQDNKTQEYSMSNVSHDNVSDLIEPEVTDQPMMQPNKSMPIYDPEEENEMKVSKVSKLQKLNHFNNDSEAYETWMACCDINDDTFGYYSAMYPMLCELFAKNTKCSRVPKQKELEHVILQHGATKVSVSKFGSVIDDLHLHGTIQSDQMIMITPPITPADSSSTVIPKYNKHLATVSGSQHGNNRLSGSILFDFDNPNTAPKFMVTIKYENFYKFWKWFVECCHVISELRHIWDANEQSILRCNLFCEKDECEQILQQSPQGTFMLRLSFVISGGIVLSYCQKTFGKKERSFKHTMLVRVQDNLYELRKQQKKRRKSVGIKKNESQRLTTISQLVRSFTKIKFLYTSTNLYPKKSVF